MYIICCQVQISALASASKAFPYFRILNTSFYVNHSSSGKPLLILTLMCQIRPQFIMIFKQVINSKQMFGSNVGQRISMSGG